MLPDVHHQRRCDVLLQLLRLHGRQYLAGLPRHGPQQQHLRLGPNLPLQIPVLHEPSLPEQIQPSVQILVNGRCVTQCPSYTNGTLSALNCTVNSAVSNCAYKYIVKADGSGISLGGGSQEVFGYDSSVTIDRVCVPKTSSFSYFNGQNSTSTSSFSSGLSGGSLTNLMTDIQNVNIEAYTELVYSIGWIRSGHPRLTHLHVPPEVPRRTDRLDLDYRHNRCPHRVRLHPVLFRWPLRSSKYLLYGLHHADYRRRSTIHNLLWVWCVGYCWIVAHYRVVSVQSDQAGSGSV